MAWIADQAHMVSSSHGSLSQPGASLLTVCKYYREAGSEYFHFFITETFVVAYRITLFALLSFRVLIASLLSIASPAIPAFLQAGYLGSISYIVF